VTITTLELKKEKICDRETREESQQEYWNGVVVPGTKDSERGGEEEGERCGEKTNTTQEKRDDVGRERGGK